MNKKIENGCLVRRYYIETAITHTCTVEEILPDGGLKLYNHSRDIVEVVDPNMCSFLMSEEDAYREQEANDHCQQFT